MLGHGSADSAFNFTEVSGGLSTKLLEIVFEGTGELFCDFELSACTEVALFNPSPATFTGRNGTGTADASSCRTCFRIEEDERLTANVGIN